MEFTCLVSWPTARRACRTCIGPCTAEDLGAILRREIVAKIFSTRGGDARKKRSVLFAPSVGCGVCFGRKESHAMSSRFSSRTLFIAAASGLLLSTAWAQTANKAGPKYDVKNEVKIKGVIEEIRQVSGPLEGTNLVVKTESKTVLVHVAPADFLKEIDTTFNKGEQVEVVGC